MTLWDRLAAYGQAVMFGNYAVQPATFHTPSGLAVVAGSGREGTPEAWQAEAYRAWKTVGELHYPSTRLSRQASQSEWRVRVGGRELQPTAAKREMETLTHGLGPAGAVYLIYLNRMIAGECWYVEVEPDTFAVWSVMEKDLDKRLAALRSQGRIVLRTHQPDPTDTARADSSMRTALGPAEELVVLESLSRAQARSRLSQAGVIVTPAEQLYADADPWELNLQEAMAAAIKDERSPSAFSPIHVRMRQDLIEKVRYIMFPRPYDDLIDRKMERAIRRIAGALDIEPEVLLGLGDATFWNAWAVSMDTYQAHLAPHLDAIGDLFARVSEALRRRANPNETSPVVEIEADPRVMLARRSTVRDALDGLSRGVVGFRFVRDAIGATEADAPTDEELEIILELNGRSVDRERRVGENPGPARSNPDNASLISDFDVALHARKAVGFKLRDAWRNTPKRNRLSGLDAPDFTAWVPLEEVAREMPLVEVVSDAVFEVAAPEDRERLTSWIIETLVQPLSTLRAKELV